MPQDSLKSAVYRSFVTCDDPKGVVDSKSTRKLRRSHQKMDHRMESQRTPKDSNKSMAYKSERKEMLPKGFKEEVGSPSSFQLMEVSRGVQNLNRMIDSWSKGVRSDGQSKYMAEDILKGALDLQESLIMLGKLQEASEYMTQSPKKQAKGSERRRIDEPRIERTQSSEYWDRNSSMRSRKPSISVNGSSRDPIEELRNVIRDSFSRQNLLPIPTTEQMGCLHTTDLDSNSEITSTSSNQSSMVHAYEFGSTEPALPSTAPQKAKGPNLIAKLMGLEDLPSKPQRTPLQKYLESERILNQRRHVFDIDMPRGRKPESVILNADPEQRTLKKILQTMQFKGLLKSNSVKKLPPECSHFNAFHPKQRSIDEIPTIVLIKPSHVPSLMEELHIPVLQEEKVSNTKKMPGKLKKKEKLPSKDHKERALSSKKTRRKMEAIETPSKTLCLEEGSKHKEVVRKTEDKKVKSKEKASRKPKASKCEDQKLQKKEAIDKKAHKIKKVASTSRKPLEADNVKAEILSKSEDQATATSTKARKHGSGSNMRDNQNTRRSSTIRNSIRKLTSKPTNSNPADKKKSQAKKRNPFRDPIEAKSAVENLGSKEVGRSINPGHDNCSPLLRTDASLVEQHPSEGDKDEFETHIEEPCSSTQSSLSDVTQLNPKYELDYEAVEEAYNHIFHGRTDIKGIQSGTKLQSLLLSSPSFLTRAEELFDLNVWSPVLIQTLTISDLISPDVKLSLECANELTERKSLRDSQKAHPLLLTCLGNLKVRISINNLVEEVCQGVENLRSYSKPAGESPPFDSVYPMLERDIHCNGVENALWDFGWRSGFSADDAEQIVDDIEMLVFDALIQEVFT